NAGSGKTQVLVQRVIRLLLEGVEPASILCITYTKAAAAEMADRLYAQLAGWTALSDDRLCETISSLGADGKSQIILTRARKLFTLALETPGGLKIQTIHAFCERLLHLFPVEAGLAPGFSLLEDRAADELRERAIAQVTYGQKVAPQVAQAFDVLSDRLNKDQFGTVIKEFISGLRKSDPAILDFTPYAYSILLKEVAGLLPSETYDEVYADFTRIDRETYARCAEVLAGYPTHKNVPNQLRKISTSTDVNEALLDYYFTDALTLRKSLFSVRMNTDHPAVTEFITKEASRLDKLLLRLHSLELIEANAQSFTIAAAALRQIELEKKKSAKVDFDDLIRRTAQLLSTSQARDWVTFKLDPGLSHILLDESQDTGPAQWIIINRLAEEFFAGEGKEQKFTRTLFVVGDDKQSIFSFQGADASSYATARLTHVEGGRLNNVTLDISYRSTDVVLAAVDKVHTLQNNPEKLLREHTAHRSYTFGIVEIWPLGVPDEKATEDPWQKPIDRPPQSSPKRVLARQIASRIKQWLDPQAPRKLAGRDKAVSAGDILILFRSRGPLFHMVMAELRAADVPVAGADRLSLLKSLIVQDILALLNWLLLPQDDHALACILKSPLLPQPLSESELFDVAYDRGSKSVFSRLTGKNFAWLKRLTEAAVVLPPDELLALILNQCRSAIGARLGPEALEASAAMLDMALSFQAEGGASLFGFVQWFQGTETTLKREMSKAGSEVRLMTVHGAKGLEAPIVIIADAAQDPFGARGRPRIVQFKLRDDLYLPLWFASGTGPLLPSLEELKEKAKALEL
ncbi:MAG TPA: UvrD-helicase domain-containing protein, partial [Aestuariivirga sp.]